MTEAEWLGSDDPTPMLEFVQYRASSRDRRLFGCACCRRVEHLLPDQRSRAHLDAVERECDQTENGLAATFEGTLPVASGDPDDYAHDAALMAVTYLNAEPTQAARRAAIAEAAFRSGRWLEDDDEGWKHEYRAERKTQAHILRDIFGNPFRPVAFDAAWRTGTAVALARQMYESRDFGAMPILADALQDAGCDRDDVLAHCRDPHATHVRGCWVVDLVLGKQ